MSMPQPPQIPFRQYAKDHVLAARRLLEGQGNELRYACLELRLAIEALAYSTLQTYSEDVDDAVARAHDHWQPNKVLEALAAYDPMADVGLTVTFHTVSRDGSVGEHVFSGTDRRFTAEWAAKAHRSMGSFLHQRTISQIKRGKTINETDLRRQANEVLEMLDGILASEVHDIRLGVRFGYQCPDCQSEMSVAMTPLLLTGRASTTCPGCGVAWLA
jgi:hypothetical protein